MPDTLTVQYSGHKGPRCLRTIAWEPEGGSHVPMVNHSGSHNFLLVELPAALGMANLPGSVDVDQATRAQHLFSYIAIQVAGHSIFHKLVY